MERVVLLRFVLTGKASKKLPAETRTLIPTKPSCQRLGEVEWSEWRESNPRSCLGKAEHYHYATLAYELRFRTCKRGGIVDKRAFFVKLPKTRVGRLEILAKKRFSCKVH